MKNATIKNGYSTGLVFGIIILTMFLIGFTVIGNQLLAKLIGNEGYKVLGQTEMFIVFMGLIGLWNGSTAAKKPNFGKDELMPAITSGLLAGMVTGLVALLLSLLFGALLINKVDVRTYLVSISPDSVKLFLFGQTPVLGGVYHLGIAVVTGLLGAFFAHFFRSNQTIRKLFSTASDSMTQLLGSSQVASAIHNPYVKIILYLVLAAILIIVPRYWGSYWNYVFGTVGIYILLGIGLNMISGWAGQLVIGYVAFFAVGAYAFSLLTSPAPHNLMWNFWIALAIGVVAAGISGLLIGLPILNLRGDYLAIVTLGLAEIIRILLKSDMLTSVTGGPRGLQKVGGPTLFGNSITSDIDFMYLIIIAVLVVTFFAYRLQNSRTGKAWYAINLDETVARATGINAYSSKLLALTLSAAIAGLAGALFASRNQFTGPDDHALMVSINVLCLVIVGGIGNIPGIFLGAFALKGLPEILREVENYRMLVFGVLLIVMMRIRPEGFLPSQRPKLEKPAANLTASGKE